MRRRSKSTRGLRKSARPATNRQLTRTWLEVSSFAREILGFTPESRQIAVLDSPERRGILCCHRQWGKSTTVAIKAVHHAWTNPRALILFCSPSLRQSNELLDKIRHIASRLEPELRGDGHNRLSLVFSNGARILAVPAQPVKVRAFSSVSMILIDEAARVEDAVYSALTPVLARTNGEVWLMSTPNGRSGFFYDLWQNGDPAWLRIQSTVDDCPWINPEFLAREKNEKSEAAFLEEYYCVFQDSRDQLIASDDIEAAFKQQVETLASITAPRFNCAQYHFYIGLDLGQSRDHTAIAAVELYTLNTGRRDPQTIDWILEKKMQLRHLEQVPLRTPYEEVANRVSRLINRYPIEGHATLIVDATGVGRPVVETLRKVGIRATIIPVTITGSGSAHQTRDGYNVPRHDLFAALEVVFQKRNFDIGSNLPSQQILRRELSELRAGSDSHPGDLSMALALALWQARKY